jgi:O-antigen ligase
MFRVANLLALVAFTLSAVVQLNDPDPLRWMSIYGAAVLACLLDLVGRARWWVPAAVGAAALAWSATIAPDVLGRVPFLDMFGAWEMENAGVERSREIYGLLIVAAWMAILAIRGLLRTRGGAPEDDASA